jgi:hypothetical protein
MDYVSLFIGDVAGEGVQKEGGTHGGVAMSYIKPEME